jgi:hypothetical protein
MKLTEFIGELMQDFLHPGGRDEVNVIGCL